MYLRYVRYKLNFTAYVNPHINLYMQYALVFRMHIKIHI
jgi:hypothetical protein